MHPQVVVRQRANKKEVKGVGNELAKAVTEAASNLDPGQRAAHPK
jgi:hypothetical protein